MRRVSQSCDRLSFWVDLTPLHRGPAYSDWLTLYAAHGRVVERPQRGCCGVHRAGDLNLPARAVQIRLVDRFAGVDHGQPHGTPERETVRRRPDVTDRNPVPAEIG